MTFMMLKQNKRQQEIEIGLWEEQEAKRREECEKLELEFHPEHKEWEVLKEKDYITSSVEYAVCLDTMGQDRKFNQTEIDLSLKAISFFCKYWEEQERKNLRDDVNRRVEKANEDRVFIDRYKSKFEEIQERWIDQNTEETDEPKEESARIEERKRLRLEFFKKMLTAQKL